jgi:hypothetical protein
MFFEANSDITRNYCNCKHSQGDQSHQPAVNNLVFFYFRVGDVKSSAASYQDKIKVRKWKEDDNNDDTQTKGEDEDSNKNPDDAETCLIILAVIRPYVVSMLDHHGADEDGAKQNRLMKKAGYEFS